MCELLSLLILRFMTYFFLAGVDLLDLEAFLSLLGFVGVDFLSGFFVAIGSYPFLNRLLFYIYEKRVLI